MIDQGARIRAVIVNYNGGDLLERAVRSILTSDWNGPVDVVVVDNDSTDGSLGRVERLEPVSIIRRPTNEGFPANNHGFADLLGVESDLDLERPEAIMLLNPDAAVRPDTIRRLASGLDPDRRIGAASPKIIFDQPFIEIGISAGDITITAVRVAGTDVTARCHGVDGAFRLPGRVLPIWRCRAGSALRVPTQQLGDQIEIDVARRSHGELGPIAIDGADTVEIDTRHRPGLQIIQNAGSALRADGVGLNRGFASIDGEAGQPDQCAAWCGAAVLLHATYIDDLGGFEPSYFLYYEDTDLSLRGLARGWGTRYVEDAIVEHRHSDSSTQGTRLVEVLQHRNRLLMLVRNAPLGIAVGAYLRALVTPASLLVSAARSPAGVGANIRLAGWRLRSVGEAVVRVPHALRGRRAIGKTRQVSARVVYATASESGTPHR